MHAHAASAVINFCEGAQHDTLVPYLDTIVDRLLKLLNPGTVGKPPKRYVQEQVITTLAMVADVSEATFAKVRHLFCRLFRAEADIRVALSYDYASASERTPKREYSRVWAT